MRLLISYLKEKLPVVGVYAVMLVIFCILFWLKEVPFDVIEYGAELSANLAFICGSAEFLVLSEAVSKSAGSVCGTSA